jgi:hypothetical protein
MAIPFDAGEDVGGIAPTLKRTNGTFSLTLLWPPAMGYGGLKEARRAPSVARRLNPQIEPARRYDH